MKFRVMGYDGTLEDFETEAQARIFFDKKREGLKGDKVKGETIPSCNMHKCYHDEASPKPCEVLESWRKQ